MLSVAPMNLARAQYHEHALGRGLDDYYSEWGERPGSWWGAGAELLGLEGPAEPGSIVSLIEGRDPKTGLALRRPQADRLVRRRVFDPVSGEVVERRVELKRVGGWDFAFSAPKSISLALAFGDQETRREVLAAHRAGVSAALELLEREAIRVRVGYNGVKRHTTHGLVGVVIEHAWARTVSEDAAPDPQLHTHVVVGNMAKSAEDDCVWWRTLDMQPVLREWKRAAGGTYHAVLRHEITTRLGWEWHAPHYGMAELARWPKPVLRVFSRRREQIEAFLAGETPTWARAQIANFKTRQAKQHVRDERADLNAARARLADHLTEPQLAALLSRGRTVPKPTHTRRLGIAFAQLAGEHGLTERDSTFTRGDVVRELAWMLTDVPETATLVSAADRFLAHNQIVQIDERRYTTRSLQAAEQRIAEIAARPAPRRLLLADASGDRGIARVEASRGFKLSEEQRALVHGVLADDRSVTLVRAVAGSGKTTTLAAIAAAYAEAGIPVTGVAPTGAAARVMTEAGIPARTVERALLDRERAIRSGIRPTPGVVLVDEAGTVGTRTLAKLATIVAQADGKLVLVGDDAQLPPVPAGAAYAQLVDEDRSVLALETPRRFLTPDGQPDLAEARALAQLRTGTLEGTAAYLSHKQQTGTIETLDRAAALDAATAWHAQRVAEGLDPTRVALIARSNELRAILTQRAREAMREAGLLGFDHTGLARLPLAVGDIVVCRQNDRRIGVANGARGRITSIDSAGIAVAITDTRSVVLPPAYARAGALEHAYAITGHLSQAATFEHAMVVAPPHHHTRHWSYTALSRSRAATRLIVLTESARDQPAEHSLPLDPLNANDALTRVAACMTRDEIEPERKLQGVGAPVREIGRAHV